MPEQIADQVARLQAQGSWVPRAEVEALRTRLDEAEEKLTELGQGCVNMTREQLIQKITAVGPARYRAGVYWQQRDSQQRHAGIREGMERAAEIADGYAGTSEASWPEAIARDIRQACGISGTEDAKT